MDPPGGLQLAWITETSLRDGCELFVICLRGGVVLLRLIFELFPPRTRKTVHAGDMTFTGNKGIGGNLFLRFLLTSAFISTCRTTYTQHTAVRQINTFTSTTSSGYERSVFFPITRSVFFLAPVTMQKMWVCQVH